MGAACSEGVHPDRLAEVESLLKAFGQSAAEQIETALRQCDLRLGRLISQLYPLVSQQNEVITRPAGGIRSYLLSRLRRKENGILSRYQALLNERINLVLARRLLASGPKTEVTAETAPSLAAA